MDFLESYLNKFATLTVNPSAFVDPLALVQDIRNLLFYEVQPNQLALCTSLLLSGENSILKFLKKTIQHQDKQFVKTKEALLLFLHDFIKLVGKRTQDYALEIKDTCFTVFRREQSNIVKIACFKPLIKLIELKLQILDGDRLEVREMSEIYLREFACGKDSQTVKSFILQILGTFCEFFPQHMSDKSAQLEQLLLDNLQKQFKSKKPDMQLISGAIKGLRSLLINFNAEFTNDHKKVQTLYHYICLSLELPPHVTRYDIPKAGLRFIATHGQLLKAYLTEDSEKMYNRLINLCKHQNKKLRDQAFMAYQSFLTQVSYEVVSGQRNAASDQATFTFFVRKFYDILNSQSSTLHEISASIIGLGKFAGPIRQFMGQYELKKVLSKLFHFSHSFTSGRSQSEDSSLFLPSFITAFGNIIVELESADIEEGCIESLERFIGAQFMLFPHLYPTQRKVHYYALSKLFLALYSKGTALKNLLSRIVFQALMLTCTNETRVVVTQTQTDENEPQSQELVETSRLYTEYLPLWKHMLHIDIGSSPDFEYLMSEQASKDITSLVYNELIAAILKFVDRLELSYTVQDVSIVDPNTNTDIGATATQIKPNKPKDYELFLNLVEFTKLLLTPDWRTYNHVNNTVSLDTDGLQIEDSEKKDKKDFSTTYSHLFKPWIYLFGKEVISKSNKYPLISGFYKMFTITLKICEAHNYFGKLSSDSVIQDNSNTENTIGMDLDPTSPAKEEERATEMSSVLFSKFIKEVLQRAIQYKDELLAACVEMVLASPTQWFDIRLLVTPAQTAFKLGVGYYPLAHIGLDAIDHWLRRIPEKTLDILPQVLPLLEPFLMVSSNTNDTAVIDLRKKREERRADFSARVVTERDAGVVIQERILRLLGKLGGHNLSLINQGTTTTEHGTGLGIGSGDPQRLSFALPFKETKIDIFVDQLLPRVVELAEGSNDRQTKIAACELLHSLILYITGKSAAVRKSDTESTHFKKLFSVIFPCMILLASGTDAVAKQIFEPLVFQMIHFFTRTVQYENEETMTLLESIIDAVGNVGGAGDASRRDFAAKCLAEFLLWSIKQVEDKQHEESPFNVKSLFKRVYSLARHPNAYKRLGYALTVSHILPILSKEDIIIDQFAFEILHNLLFSLRLCLDDDVNLATAQKTEQAVLDLSNLVVAKSNMLIKPNKRRRQHDSLQNFAEWVFKEIGRLEAKSRSLAILLVNLFAPKLPYTKSVTDWITQKMQDPNHGLDYIMSVFEPRLQYPTRKSLLFSQNNNDSDGSSSGIEELKLWVSALTMSLDCYIWALQMDFYDAIAMAFNKQKKGALPVVKNIIHFIDEFGLLKKDDDLFRRLQLTPFELESYHTLKSQLLAKLFHFLEQVLSHEQTSVSQILSTNFFKLLFSCMLIPSQLGFNATTQGAESADSNKELCSKLCRLCGKALSQKEKDTFNATLRSLLQEQVLNVFVQDFNHPELSIPDTITMLDGYIELHKNGVLLGNIDETGYQLSERLLNHVFDDATLLLQMRSQQPMQYLLNSKVLEFAFRLSFNYDAILKLLYDDTVLTISLMDKPVANAAARNDLGLSFSLGTMDSQADASNDNNKEKEKDKEVMMKLSKGSVFYDQYQDLFDGYILSNFTFFAKPLLSKSIDPRTARILCNVISLLVKQKDSFGAQEFTSHFLKYSGHLSVLMDENSTAAQRERLLLILKKLIELSHVVGDSMDTTDGTTLFAGAGKELLSNAFKTLLAKGVTLSAKVAVLDLVPAILQINKALVVDSLNELIVYHFPSNSHDLPPNSGMYSEYVSALDKLLECLEHGAPLSSGITNPKPCPHPEVILEALFPVLREKDHVHKEKISAAISRFVTESSQSTKRHIFELCFQHFESESLPDDLRIFLAKSICIPLVVHMAAQDVVECFTNIIPKLMKTLIEERSLIIMDHNEKRSYLIKRSLAFNFIESMYRSLPAQTIKEQINNRYFQTQSQSQGGAKGNELTTAVMKCAHAAKSEHIKGALGLAGIDETIKDLILEYHTSAYNALAIVVLSTQTRENFFTVFCFKENPEKLWENIVDLEKVHKFEVETQFPVARKIVHALKVDMLNPTVAPVTPQSGVPQSSAEMVLRQGPQALHFLADSSLSQDVSSMAFFKTKNTGVSVPEKEKPKENEPQKQDQRESQEVVEDVLLDDFNAHPCMNTILQIVDHITKHFAPDPSFNNPEMPKYMVEMYNKFTKAETHPNVLLFLLKIIINRPLVFKPYAQQWTRPILSFVSRVWATNENINDDDATSNRNNQHFHYWLRDICILFLKWKVVPKDSHDDRVLVSQFMNHLIRVTPHGDKDILKWNITVVNLLATLWKGYPYAVSKKRLLEYLLSDNATKRMSGLQILGVLLLNDHPLYDRERDSNVLPQMKYMEAILGNLHHYSKEVYCAAAEVAGLSLNQMLKTSNFLSNEPSPDDSPFSQSQSQKKDDLMFAQLVKDKINDMFAKAEYDRLLNCLERIGLHCQPFMSQFYLKIFQMLPKIHGDFKVIALELIYKGSDQIDDLMIHIQPEMNKILTQRNDQVQLLALKILHHVVQKRKAKWEQILNILEALLSTFATHTSMKCREEYYNLLEWLYDNFPEARLHVADNDGKGNTKSVPYFLFSGLSDPSDEISSNVFKFWNTKLAGNLRQRLFQLFGEHYNSDIEEHWINTCTQLLLNMTRGSPDYERVLFDRPLADTEFKEYTINTGVSTMTAVQSQFQFVGASQAFNPSISVGGGTLTGVTRSTHQYLYSTQQTAAAPSQSQETQASQLLGNDNNVVGGNIGEFVVPPSIETIRHTQQSRRSTQGPSSVRNRWSYKKPSYLTKQREQFSKLNRKNRQTQVIIHRKYRAGEQPDIQIKHRDIIDPLQSVLKRDPAVARLLFSQLVKGIVATSSENEWDEIYEKLKKEVDSILKQSLLKATHSTSLIATLLGIAYDSPAEKFLLSSELVSEISLQSFNFHTGILLLEKQIQYYNQKALDPEHRALKRAKYVNDVEDNDKFVRLQEWSQLCKLYKALGEDDILKGIFQKQIANNPFTQEGLAAELRGDYMEALSIYEKATRMLDEAEPWGGNPPTAIETEFWENSRLESLVMLTRWSDLADNTMAEIDNDTNKLFQEKYIEPYLQYYITSHLKIKEKWPDLWNFIDSAMVAHKDFLEKRFPIELALVAICRNDFDRARYFVNSFYKLFLSDWTKLHSFDFTGKHIKLQSLQPVVEIEEFLRLLSQERAFESFEVVSELLGKWSTRYPSAKVDSIVVWDNIVTSRSLMFEKLNERFSAYWNSKMNDDDMQTEDKRNVNLVALKSMLLEERSNAMRKIADAARKQNNLYVSDQYVRGALKAKTKKKEFAFGFFQSLVKLYIEKADRSQVEKIEKMVRALKFVEGKKSEEEILSVPDYRKRYLTMYGQCYSRLAELAISNPNGVAAAVNENFPDMNASEDTIAQQLYRRSFECYNEASQLCLTSENNAIAVTSTAKVMLKFGLFCDKLLKQPQMAAAFDTEELANTVMKSILESMSRHSVLSSDRFPRLLELLTQHPTTSKTFIEMTKQIPCWLFIKWIPQLIAVLGSQTRTNKNKNNSEANAILGILMEIARLYPQAVYYPWKISSEDFSDETLKLCQPLAALLKNELLDQFVSSLQLLTHPEHRFKDWIEQLKPHMKDKQKSNQQVKEIQRICQEMYQDIFDPMQSNAGAYNKKFAVQWNKHFLASFGKDGSELVKMDNDKFTAIVAEMNEQMVKAMNPKGSAKMKLSEFSHWLNDFEQSQQLSFQYIEIPGQYKGNMKPSTGEHIKATSFDSSVLVMSSLRKPKRLKIHGNDEREYAFLVKGGEDLRLDQRIQQLFGVINQILQSDAAACKRKLFINTYQVIPMSSKVGIIQWVENTKPLKEIIEEEISKVENKRRSDVSILKIPAAALQDAWIKSFANKIVGKKRNHCDFYYAMFQYASRIETEKQVQKQHSTLQSDLLKRGIMSLCSSPEGYLTTRAQFAKTLATFNIASYILGIGDRHLENFLLNLSDGAVIGIDFGHAFGTATQFLPIPELIPFRLTRQFTGFLEPLDTDGLLKHNMVHTLTALQYNQDILLNTMDVFIKEPLIDWEKLARRVAREQGAEEQSASWFPTKKIEIVKRKLRGDNPAHITVSELNESVHAAMPYIKQLKQIVAGDPTVNVRAKVSQKCADAKQQVDCLVDQATDPNILGRTWFGWAPFI